MGLLKNLAVGESKKAAKIAANKAEKFLSNEENIEKAAEFISNATNKAVKSETVSKVTEKMKSANVSGVVKKSFVAAKETVDIFKSQKVLAKLQQEGKIISNLNSKGAAVFQKIKTCATVQIYLQMQFTTLENL